MIQRQIILLLAIISVFVLAATGSQAAATGNLRASVAPPSGNKDKNSHERNERLRRLVECDSRCSQPNATGIPIPDYYNIAAAVVYYTTWPDQNPYGTVPNCWDTSQVTDMSYGFFDQDFNERIDCWDTSNVVTMQGMFQDVPSFNQPLNTWNVSKVTDMSRYVLHMTMLVAFCCSLLIVEETVTHTLPLCFQNSVCFIMQVISTNHWTSGTSPVFKIRLVCFQVPLSTNL
jgi:surface protein